jgi:menaquinone-dependent protoporphyrinogen IX oxidase
MVAPINFENILAVSSVRYTVYKEKIKKFKKIAHYLAKYLAKRGLFTEAQDYSLDK